MDRMYKLGQAYRKMDDFLQKGLLSKVKDRFGKKKTSTSKALTVFDPKKALPSKLPSAAKKLSKLGKVARFARAATPLALGLEAANLAYKVATLSPEKKAKVKKLKTKLSKKSTKDYHADLLKANLGLLAMKKAKQKGAKSIELLSPLAMSKRFFNKGGDTMGLKPIPEGKEKSLGKLPTKVRNRMGFEKDGGMMKASMGMEAKSSKGYGAARTSGMGLQDEQLVPGKSLDYYKDIM